MGEYDPFLIGLDTLCFLLLPFFAVFMGPVVLWVLQKKKKPLAIDTVQ